MYMQSLRGLALNESFGAPDTIMSYSEPSYDSTEGMWQPQGWDTGIAPMDTPPANYYDAPTTSSPRASAPSGSVPTASGTGFDWTSLFKTAISTYGTVAVERTRADAQTQRAALTNRYPVYPTPSYSPFPGGGYAPGGDSMGFSTTTLIAGGLLLAGVAYALTRN